MKKKWAIALFSFFTLLPPPFFQKGGATAHEARGWEVPLSQTEPEDYWLFLPRLALTLPRYVFTGVFYPIIETGAWVEREAIVEHMIDFLYNDARTAAVLPTGTFSLEYGHLLGIRAFHKDLFKNKERIEFEAVYGSPHRQFYRLSFRGDRVGGSPIWIDSHVGFSSLTSLRFSGIGNEGEDVRGRRDPRDSNVLTRYSKELQKAKLSFGYGFGPSFLTLSKRDKEEKPTYKIGMSAIFQKQKFHQKRRSKHEDPSIEEVYDSQRLLGFEKDSGLWEIRGDFRFNLLNVEGQPSRGSTLNLFFGGVPGQDSFSYLHYGFENELYFNLYRDNRVLLLKTLLESVEGENDRIPFYAYPVLGGAKRLRGYYLDTFRDKHAATVALEYRYPIHQYVLGELFADVGTVSEKYSELGRHWHPGFGFGFLFGTQEELQVKLDVSFGEKESVFFVTLNAPGAIFGD